MKFNIKLISLELNYQGWGINLIETTKNKKLVLVDSHESSDNVIYVFSRRIKDKDLSEKNIGRRVDKEKITAITTKLMDHGKERDINEIELETNCNEWILDIFENYPDKKEISKPIRYLLNSFTSYMKTRRREDDRYVVSIISKDYILLANTVFGEETITPTYEIIPRMMDKDNVMLYVIFRKDKYGKIKVRYYEFYPSDFFMNWLGLPQKDSHFYQGGKYRVYTDILGNTTVFELGEEDIDKLSELIVDNQIKLEKPLELININQIRIGKVRYKDFLSFYDKFMDERYELDYYSNKFMELISNLNTQVYSYRDCNDGVERLEEGYYNLEIKKHNPNFNILFGTNNGNVRIGFDRDYINELCSKYSNGNTFKIFHAGDKRSVEPIKICSMDIHNELSSNISKFLINYLNETNFRDRDLFYMLSSITFKILAYENSDKHINTFFNEISSKCISMLKNRKITDNEDEILEFKGSEYFRGSPDDISDKIITDLKKKLGGNDFKVYLIGVVEPPKGKLDPIPQQQLTSDHMKFIEKRIEKENYVNKAHISAIEVDNDNSIVALTVLGEKTNKDDLMGMFK